MYIELNLNYDFYFFFIFLPNVCTILRQDKWKHL